jgi:hypothetical protein
LVKKPVWGPRIPGIDGLLQDLQLIEVCALQWRTCVEAARTYGQSLPAGRYMECRLEELSIDRLDQIMKFCQLEESSEVRAAFERQFDPNQTSHRRSAANDEELKLIQPWIAATIEWLGANQSSFSRGARPADPAASGGAK